MALDKISGFVFGVVTDNADPEGTGRVKVCIPGIIEPQTGYWVMPAGWPGAGEPGRGSAYPPPPIDAHVMVLFEHGIYRSPESHAIYLTGYYGLDANGQQAGPDVLNEAPTALAANKRTVLWEGKSLLAYIIEDDDEEKLVLKCKTSGSKIELNAKDGTGGKSETVTIEARTLLTLYAKGIIDIRSDTGVQIQGRKVDGMTTRSL